MANLIVKLIIFLIYFTNIIFAQSTPVELTGLNHFNLTTTCKTSIASLVEDRSIKECLPMFTIITSIPQLLPTTQKDPESKIGFLAQLIRQTCSLPKCSSSLVQSVALTLQENCSQDLLQNNVMATLNILLFSHYKPIQELACKRDSSKQYNPYCILETIINMANSTALNKRHVHHNITLTSLDPTITSASVDQPTLPSSETAVAPPISSTAVNDGNNKNNSSTLPISQENFPSQASQDSLSLLKTLELLPNSLVCTDCNKAMVSVVLKYLNENPTALNGTQIQPTMIQQGSQALGLKCGSSFLDGSTPNTISSSPKLLYSYIYNYVGIFIIEILLLL
ncbi:hypothetical protein RhiirA5_497582 [Rhizophagus irregularis]|uniref:DUF7729 domain-containing protein n=3 Tax=Rhizophagus irregularis TaxID=588596 RepID=U9TC25_RHIID|nr:hypothetical protein GLOIN_2v1525371 [Rhizophagus irregularis DAOM 181602=DAOM 197198]PKC11540.1 hypothetical protein RhiirA5_497582 [Rhizophagus irregularis]PKC76490.1 hypothetical protein RhiirA1_435548 [Rhizophagus irregularis]PKY17454.1 hypothetical protein RhiirB3_487509 [Rhizophagus irregularis]POG79717.1 hypothetical protein GLOIN_2v1525371 [Rhizophagus irregularis DAOM 181602=DAOM 197198]UZO16082.1 hypothetical protein OCT59_007478 [Rhizophagus irregularis]|eukprot:XP_025186583.1 hypothetical protein GLOIN_2v1525371 [Rhizophagus irregularis DAOM 181602=DAOM 197198]